LQPAIRPQRPFTLESASQNAFFRPIFDVADDRDGTARKESADRPAYERHKGRPPWFWLGMQPVFTQVPPNHFLSTMATFIPEAVSR